MAGFLVVDFLRKRIVSTNLSYRGLSDIYDVRSRKYLSASFVLVDKNWNKSFVRMRITYFWSYMIQL